MRFLQTLGYSELTFGPYGLILAEAHVEYMSELFLGETLEIDLSITAPTRVAFECYYQIKSTRAGKEIKAAVIKTNMICFDYKERKVKSIPDDIKVLLTAKSQG
jgi:acyl-CoA thioesterase FadM